MHGQHALAALLCGACLSLAAACGADARAPSCFAEDSMSRPASLPPTVDHWSGAEAALADAAACGDASGIRAAVARGADPNAIGRQEMPMLLWPVLAGSEDGFRLLLEAGADPNARIDRARTKAGATGEPERDSLALALLAQGPYEAFLDAALVHGLDPNAVSGGEPLVWRMALGGQWDSVKRLIEAGADVDANDVADGPRYTLLGYFSTGAFDKALWLLDHGADPGIAIEREREDGSAYQAYPILENVFYYEVDARAFPELAAAQGEMQRRVLSMGHERPPRPRRYAE